MEYYDGVTRKYPPVSKPRELLDANDLVELSDLIVRLDDSGAEVTGTIQFKGHSIGLAHDSTTNRHYVGI